MGKQFFEIYFLSWFHKLYDICMWDIQSLLTYVPILNALIGQFWLSAYFFLSAYYDIESTHFEFLLQYA